MYRNYHEDFDQLFHWIEIRWNEYYLLPLMVFSILLLMRKTSVRMIHFKIIFYLLIWFDFIWKLTSQPSFNNSETWINCNWNWNGFNKFFLFQMDSLTQWIHKIYAVQLKKNDTNMYMNVNMIQLKPTIKLNRSTNRPPTGPSIPPPPQSHCLHWNAPRPCRYRTSHRRAPLPQLRIYNWPNHYVHQLLRHNHCHRTAGRLRNGGLCHCWCYEIRPAAGPHSCPRPGIRRCSHASLPGTAGA